VARHTSLRLRPGKQPGATGRRNLAGDVDALPPGIAKRVAPSIVLDMPLEAVG